MEVQGAECIAEHTRVPEGTGGGTSLRLHVKGTSAVWTDGLVFLLTQFLILHLILPHPVFFN